MTAAYWNKPCAAAPLLSYRAVGLLGFIMIGATDDADAMREATRSTALVYDLQKWDGEKYVSIITADCKHEKRATMPTPSYRHRREPGPSDPDTIEERDMDRDRD